MTTHHTYKAIHTEGFYETALADPTKTKRCPRCGEAKALTEFHRATRASDGFGPYCKPCTRTYHQKHYKEASQAYHATHIARTYGLAADEYAGLMRSQGGVCAICGTPPGMGKHRMHVDHNHTTGAVRGILCGNCNQGLGQFKDDPAILAKALDYLLRF